MATVAVKPFVLRDVDLVIGTDNYEAHVSQCEYVPSTSQLTWTGLASNTATASSPATWVLTIAHAQDWETTNSLSQYLHEHEGETVSVTLTPKDGAGTFTSDVTITPGNIGGTAAAFATGTVSMGSTKPVFTPAVAP
jgi:hypothetical protein